MRLVTVVLVLVALLLLAGCSVLVDRRADFQEAQAEARFPPEGQLIEVDGRTVHVVDIGQGPDLVLLHGASGSTRDMTFSLTDRLKESYRVLVFDRPGLGWTDRISDDFGGAFNTRAESPIQQARFLAKAARQMGAERPIVMGHSYGGAVAMGWALEEDAAALVVTSGATMPWEGGLGPLYAINASALGGAEFVPLLTAFAPRGRVDEVLETIFAPQAVPDGYLRHIGVGLSLRRESLRANARQVNSLKPHVQAMSERYQTIRIPVEILHGDADDIVPHRVHAIPLSERLPNSDLTLLPGVGHMPHHVATDTVVDAIDRAAARAGLR